MACGLLLTDDEVVSLAAISGRPWPVGLITVAATADAVRSAAARGLRSLTVRGIVTTDGEAADSTHPGIAAVIECFVRAANRIGAYIAPAGKPDVLAGASITAVPVADVWWLDSANAQGVHGFRRVNQEQALDALMEFGDRIGDGTLLTDVADPAGYTGAIRYGDGPDQVIAVPVGSADRWDRATLMAACIGAPVTTRSG